jgi:hypothetical protein
MLSDNNELLNSTYKAKKTIMFFEYGSRENLCMSK